MKGSHWAGATALSLLAACSTGGSGGGGGTAPTPTPTPPAPTPTPTPTPTATYSTFAALTGSQSYPVACGSYRVNTTGPGVGAGDGTSLFPYSRIGGKIYFNPDQSYSVYSATNTVGIFFPADRDLTAPANVIAFAKPSVKNMPGTERFRITQPSAAGIPFDYSRSAFYDFSGHIISTNAGRLAGYCAIGVATQLTDFSGTAIVDYTRFAVEGEARDWSTNTLYMLTKSSATFRVDPASGQVTTTLVLVGTVGGTDYALGTYTGTGTIDRSSLGFYIPTTFNGQAGGSVLGVQGGFFGPQGREFGYAFHAALRDAGTPTLTIVGSVLGAR